MELFEEIGQLIGPMLKRRMFVALSEPAGPPEAEARAIMAEEPYHKRGMRTFTLHEWSLNQGRVTLQVDFSSQKAGVDGPPAP